MLDNKQLEDMIAILQTRFDDLERYIVGPFGTGNSPFMSTGTVASEVGYAITKIAELEITVNHLEKRLVTKAIDEMVEI